MNRKQVVSPPLFLFVAAIVCCAILGWWIYAPESQVQRLRHSLGLPPVHSESGKAIPGWYEQMDRQDSEPQGDFRGFDEEGNAIYAPVENADEN